MQLPKYEVSQIQLDCKGLFTNPNELSKIPVGGLLQALNITIDKPGIGESRRGFQKYGDSLVPFGSVVDSGFIFQDTLLWHIDNTFIYDSDNLGTWIAYSGSFSIPIDAFQVRSIQSNKNIYFTTTTGLQKLDKVTNAIRAAGVPQGLDGSGTTSGSSGWMPDQTNVAYRIVWGYIDENNNTILGAPSQRIIVSNISGGTRNVDLTFTIPDIITTSYFYQVYRSPESINLSTQPNDEEQLVIQNNPSSGQIAAKVVTLTDTIPDTLMGATIYTAASQQGILQANLQPPIATDITFFKNFVFYADTKTPQIAKLQLISIGSPDGVQVNDSIVIDGTTYTAKNTENAATGQFKVFTGGTMAENIDATARSLVHVINADPSNTNIYAYYISESDQVPGIISLQERVLGGVSFAVVPSRPTSWLFDSTSTNEHFPAGVYISKFQQPEAVPVENFIEVGSADKKILRVLALRNSVFFFKEDGLFRLTGDDVTNFTVEPWDTTVILRSPKAAVLLQNQIYAFTTQGVVGVSETGTNIYSFPIEKDLLRISSEQFTNFNSVTFGISYESDRKFIFNTISSENSTASDQSFVYNYFTDSWTQWVLPHNVSSGILNTTNNKLYFASVDTSFPFVYQERKNYDETDFADDQFDVTITGFSGTTVFVNTTANLLVGDTIQQNFIPSIITSIINSTTITVSDLITWNNADAIVYRPIDLQVTWTPIHGGNPTIMKLFKEIQFFFLEPDFSSLIMNVTSDISGIPELLNTLAQMSSGWGDTGWGDNLWGEGIGGEVPIRTWSPLDKARSHWLNIQIQKKQALTNFTLNGLMIVAEPMSYRIK